MLGAVLCVAATVAVVFVHEHERQSVELLFKWGPPSIRPGGEKKAEPLRSWSPPQMLPAVMRTEEASMPIVEVDEKNEQHQQHAKQHKQAPFAVNVDVDQQDSKNVKFAPVSFANCNVFWTFTGVSLSEHGDHGSHSSEPRFLRR